MGCLHQQRYIGEKILVLNVPDIHFHPLLEADIRAAANLPKARQAGFDRKTAALPGLVLGHFFADGRTRSDQRHLAGQYVEELRQFVDAGDPQEAADPGNANIGAILENGALLFILHMVPLRFGVVPLVVPFGRKSFVSKGVFWVRVLAAQIVLLVLEGSPTVTRSVPAGISSTPPVPLSQGLTDE